MTTKKRTPLQPLDGLQDALRELTSVDPEFPIQWALVFLDVSNNEGCALKDLSDRTGISMSVMSRTIGALSNARRMGKPYGLVLVRHAKDDRRRKKIYLSSKGKKLIDRLTQAA